MSQDREELISLIRQAATPELSRQIGEAAADAILDSEWFEDRTGEAYDDGYQLGRSLERKAQAGEVDKAREEGYRQAKDEELDALRDLHDKESDFIAGSWR